MRRRAEASPHPGLHGRIRPRELQVRPLPFPYRAAAALSWDVEFTSFALFEALMAFANGRGDTPLGRGLGLEVASSLFFHSAHPYTFSYFAGADAGAQPGPHAARIGEYLRAGWIDTNHAYGDFDAVGGFTRAHAGAALAALEREGARLDVFTNHGGPENVQNMGGDAPYHLGDVPGHEAYHADLTRAAGVRYVWTDTLKREGARVVGFVPRVAKLVARCKVFLDDPRPARPGVLVPLRLQDGADALGFVRLRGTGADAPNLDNFGLQLARLDWRRLYEGNGVAVVYQHLGVRRRTAGRCEAADLAELAACPELMGPLRFLAKERDAGRLWLAGTARLLRYLELVEGVRLRHGGPGWLDVIPPQDLPGGADALGGLTVYTAGGVHGLRHAGRELPVVRNAPDETGRESLTVPLPPLEDIWT